jgi:hypothetical protein
MLVAVESRREPRLGLAGSVTRRCDRVRGKGVVRRLGSGDGQFEQPFELSFALRPLAGSLSL